MMQAEVRKVVTHSLSDWNGRGGKRLICYKVIVQGRAVDSCLSPVRARAALRRFITARLKDHVHAKHM